MTMITRTQGTRRHSRIALLSNGTKFYGTHLQDVIFEAGAKGVGYRMVRVVPRPGDPAADTRWVRWHSTDREVELA